MATPALSNRWSRGMVDGNYTAPVPEKDVELHEKIRSCTICAACLPLGPRPVVQFSMHSCILIIGQAPGSKVHASGVPWDDPSGERLRQWTGLSTQEFYDPRIVALMPMGFCYPGRRAGGDMPPRPECQATWHERVLALLPKARLTILVGLYAQAAYLPSPGPSMMENVRGFERFGPDIIPLPHPSWRSVGWSRRNPWFEADVLPALRQRVDARLIRRRRQLHLTPVSGESDGR
jgi:uracil-DNA glycosylase